MEPEFSFKELYDVAIKTTQNIEINGFLFEKGETIASFDKIQLADFKEIKSFTSARGGFDNRSHVWWESTKEMNLIFTQGIFSQTQFALLNNTRTLLEDNSTLFINQREQVESDENGNISFKYKPFSPIFIYDYESGLKITNYTVIDEQTINIATPYKEAILDYYYEYKNKYSTFKLGSQLSNGTFVLNAKTKVKDDITGQVRTGIITIPKLKLMSELSMSLGQRANPVVSWLKAIACPYGVRGTEIVMEINFLQDDVDSDM